MKTRSRRRCFLRFPSRLFGAAVLSLTSVFAADPVSSRAREPVKIVLDGQETFRVGFDKLSAFPYTIVDVGTGASAQEIETTRKKDRVPDWIRIYHNQRVALTGFLMPLQMENGLAKKFVLMKDINTCCYGATPNMNDYVVVTMRGDGVRPLQDVPVELVGVLRVEEKYENGYVTSLFQLEGEKMLGVKK